MTDADLRLLDRYLDDDETVVWAGQPVRRRALLGTLPQFGFAVFWTAFSAFWTLTAWFITSKMDGGGLTSVFPFFGLPFLLVGLFLLAAPLRTLRRVARTSYVVTTHRAIVARPSGDGLALSSVHPEALGTLDLTVRRDGSGTIRFGTAEPSLPAFRSPTIGDVGSASVASGPRAFENVPDAEQVFDLLRALAARHRSESAPTSGDVPLLDAYHDADGERHGVGRPTPTRLRS